MAKTNLNLPDEFSELVLQGSLIVAQDKANPIRAHLASAGIRELFSHILHHYAPDEEVRACSWFVQAKDTKTVTRRQRAVFATQGGLTDDYVDSLGVDVKELHNVAIDAIDRLNKATHVRPGRVVSDQQVIDAFVDEMLDAMDGLLTSFSECRAAVCRALENNAYDALITATVTETIEELDFLSGRGYELSGPVDGGELEVLSISAAEVVVKYSGVVPITLHHGDKHDPIEIGHDFPFWMTLSAPADNPTALEHREYFFDDSGWYK
ncbi:MAG: hypothetical protein RLN85_18070 [Pseudomonadales bacterium]